VFSGMIGVTLFGIFLTPVFYYVVTWFSDRKTPPAPPKTDGTKAVVAAPAVDG
jgi:multidrug efflux pump